MKGDVVQVFILGDDGWDHSYPKTILNGEILFFISTETIDQDYHWYEKGVKRLLQRNPRKIHTFLNQQGKLVKTGNSYKTFRIISRKSKRT